jgi:hypothetical protein
MEFAMALTMIEWDPALNIRDLPKMFKNRARPGIDHAAAGSVCVSNLSRGAAAAVDRLFAGSRGRTIRESGGSLRR